VATNLTPAPLDKGKGLLIIPSDDEGSSEVQVFKRRRTNRVIFSGSVSPQHGGSLRDNPLVLHLQLNKWAKRRGHNPPPHQHKLLHKLPPEVLEIPPAIMQLMRGFTERSPGSFSGETKKEGMPYYMAAFLAIALDWHAQAKSKVIEMQTLQALKREVATLKEEKLKLEDAYQASLVETRKVEEAATLRLREADQKHADLLGSMAPL